MIIVSFQIISSFYSDLLKRRNLQVSSFEKLSGGGGVVCLIIVSTPGPVIVRVNVRFGQVDDEVGQGFVWPSW